MNMYRPLPTRGPVLTRSSERERLGLARWESEGGALARNTAETVSRRRLLLRHVRWKRPYTAAAGKRF